jgi:IS1 family transposase
VWIKENLVRDVKVKFVQADEIWSFVGMKDKTKRANNIEDNQVGSTYTFTSIDSDTKLIVAWHLGHRTERDALTFLTKVYNAVNKNHFWQITTDGWPGATAQYAQLVKIYQTGGGGKKDETRYPPAECVGCQKRVVSGYPIKDKISTSHVERANLTMRMSIRRMTRLTNAFSKKWDNLNWALALHFAHYNFCRSHKTLNGASPAMAANLTNSIWALKDLLRAATHI